MLKVGVTGGIGSGKSIVCKVFNHLGIPHYSSDAEARNIVNQSRWGGMKQAIQNAFGTQAYDQEGNFDRKKMAELVFNDKTKLEILNAIVHPAVQQHFKLWLLHHQEQKYILKEAAILFESGSYKELDFIITVFAPAELRIKRVMTRDALTLEAVKRVMKNQMSEEEKIKRSHYVIVNDEEELIIPQVLKIHNELLQK